MVDATMRKMGLNPPGDGEEVLSMFDLMPSKSPDPGESAIDRMTAKAALSALDKFKRHKKMNKFITYGLYYKLI